MILAILLTVLSTVSLQSCTKEPVTKNVHDTLVTDCNKDTVALLCANKWYAHEIRTLENGEFQYYLRGGANNAINYDNFWFKLETNGTGVYHDDRDRIWPVQWNFISGDKTKIRYEITYDVGTQVIYYENLFVKSGELPLQAKSPASTQRLAGRVE